MGINYQQATFSDEDYNGFGVVKESSFNPTGSSQPKYKIITNNTALQEHFKDQYRNIITLKPYVGKQLDNFSVPLGSYFGTLLRDHNSLEPENPFEKRLGLKSIYNELDKGYDFYILQGSGTLEQNAGWSYDEPLSPNYESVIMSNEFYDKPDWEELIKAADIDEYNISHGLYNSPSRWKFAKPFFGRLLKYGKPGIILSATDTRLMPYLQKSYADEVVAVAEKYGIFQLEGLLDNGNLMRSYIFGNAAIDSLIGSHVNVALKPGIRGNNRPIGYIGSAFVYKTTYEYMTKAYEIQNRALALYAEKFGVPLFDINALYKAINEGRYITDDGIQADGKWPGGNFYSSDGMRPTAFRHAIIANEMIKKINNHYNTKIPLISTREYLIK